MLALLLLLEHTKPDNTLRPLHSLLPLLVRPFSDLHVLTWQRSLWSVTSSERSFLSAVSNSEPDYAPSPQPALFSSEFLSLTYLYFLVSLLKYKLHSVTEFWLFNSLLYL